MFQSTKKQNRVLLVLLVTVLAAATLLIAITGSANKKTKPADPPIDSAIPEKTAPVKDVKSDVEKVSPTAKDADKPQETTAPDASGNPDEKKEEEKTVEKSVEEANAEQAPRAEAVSATPSNVLPTFSAPIDGVVLKDFSGAIPVFSYTMNDYRTHGGVDFACSPGTPVRAAADGTIKEVYDDPMMGVTVTIAHSGDAETSYRGLNEDSLSLVQVGDTVSRGDVIGASGDTALIESAEEDHLHFTLTVGGAAEDPGEFMRLSYLTDLTED